MVAKNTLSTLSKYPRNKQDNRNKYTFNTNSNPNDEVGEFLGGSFVMPGDKNSKNSIEEARPKLKSSNTLVIRDFKDGYFVERTRASSGSPEVPKKSENKKIEATPVLLTPAHLRSQSLPQTFIPEKKAPQKTRKVQDFILMTSQNIVVPKSNSNLSNPNLEYGCSPPLSPEKWAGGAYTNSPPPKHLPCPQF